MDPSCGLMDKFRDLMLDQIWEKLLYLVDYSTNIGQLNKRLVELTLQRISIQHRIDEARNNVKNIEGNVCHWLDQADKISEQVEQLHKESQAKRECGITSCPNPWLRYKLSKRAKEMTQAVVEICRNGNFPRVSYRDPPPSMPELRNKGSNEGIGSRVPIMNQIMEALRNSSVKMIGLCGPGGVGKTTIAEEVAKKGINQKMFKKVIKATVSDELNVEKIQAQIADMLGMQLNQRSDEGRAYYICERLKQEKEMLLILDDVWKELDLGKIGIPFEIEKDSRENGSCKILLTSRRKALLSEMKCQKIIEVGVLSDDEAWELFKKIAELSNDSSSPKLIAIATEIVQKCGGLPLAIATTAKTLRNKAADEWEDACARLNNPLRRNITLTKEVDAVLRLSYDHLGSSECKRVFLLAAILSRDLSIEDLLMYSMGLNILTHTQNMEDARNGFSVIVRKLKSLDLFLDSFSSHHFTMHDFIRDFAVLTASEEELHAFRMVKEWPDDNVPEDCKGICLQECDISGIPEELHGPKLEFFLLNSTKRDLTIPHGFFKSSKELKLLAFTNVHFLSLQLLSFLQKLKALCLHSCLLEDITEVGSLKKLKILSLAHSEIQCLPIELAELTSLQMLNLSHCSKLKVIPQKLLSCLKKLEVLYIRNSFDRWKVEESSEADENASLDELKDLPISSLDIQIPNISMLPENLFLKMNLRRYRIFIGKRWKWQDNYETSKILRLELDSNIDLTSRLQKLLKEVEDLHLYGSNGLENVLYNHDAGGFSCLRHLQIESNDEIKYIVLNSAHHEDAFPLLKSLELKNLKALENLCKGPNDIVFGQLDTLKMENLPSLTGDFSIKDRTTKNGSNKIFKSLFNKKVLFPKLEILELSNLSSSVELIWDDQLSYNSFSNLKRLMMKECGTVKLVPFHVLKSLNNLEELEVLFCDMLEIVFDFEDLKDDKEMDSSSAVVPMKKLRLRGLPKLKTVWSNRHQGIVSFPSLRSVDVSYCESLISIFPASIAKGMLCHLEELRIDECGIDVIVAKDQVLESAAVTFEFPSLTSLDISFLRKLRSFFPHQHTLKLPRLQRLSIEGCDELEIFEKEISSSSEIHEEESTLNSKYPLFSHHDKVIQELEELSMSSNEAEMIGSGQFLIYHFPNVKLLSLGAGKATTISYRPLLKSFTKLEDLELRGKFEKAFGGEDVARFPKLTLSNNSIMRSLSPSLVSSPNLTHLNVYGCREWTTLMTSSIARSLVHLMRLSVSYCFKMEEIITKQEGEDDEDKEIFFRKLEFLKLTHLPELRRFCHHNYTFKFPLLDKLVITRCPKFKRFSPGLIHTPSLKNVQLLQDWGEHHEIWDTNLNKTFYQQRYVTSRELMLDEDDAIMIRNDQFPMDHCPHVEILGIEGFQGWVTFPYTLLQRFPKLNELQVKNCSFKEIFPSHAPSSTSFHNLTVLKVSKCHQFVYLVTCSTVKSLVNLETLEIDDCKKMEEIVRNETNEDEERGITFNGLRILKLTRLPKLKTQKNKKDFNIEDKPTNTRCTNISRSLLSHNKVLLPKLETLELSNLLNNLVSLIWDDQLLHNSFSNLKTLIVKYCFQLTTLMTSSIARSLVHLTRLSVCYCYKMEEIITKQEGEDDEGKEIFFNLMKFLELDNLPRLKRFCGHNYTFKFPLLDKLVITRCPKFKRFSPGLIDTPSLKSVQLSRDWGEHHEIWDTSLNKTFNQQRYVTSRELVLDEDDAIMIRNDQFPVDLCPHVEILGIEGFVQEWVTFPYTLLQRFPKLNELQVKNCSFNEIFPLHAPSPTSFHNLIVLKVSKCHQFVYLVTSSTVKSLVNLETLEIDDCEKMEEIVRNETNEDEERGITFNGLRILKLTRLPKLKTEEDKKDFNIEDRATNTRSTNISRSFFSHNEVLLPKLETLELSNLLNNLVSLIWDNQLLHNTFSNLKTLIVKSCDFMKLVPLCVLKSLNKLEKLEVSYCHKLEMIFGFEDLNDYRKEMVSSSVFVPLNLTHLEVNGCHGLTSLMTSSVATCLVHITHLSIGHCNQIEEIITKQEGDDDEDKEFFFNQMKFLELDNLPRLKRFCGYNYTFRFPFLKHVTITECPQLVMFCPGAIHALRLQSIRTSKNEPHKDIWMTNLNTTIQHLFTFEEVISTCRSMALNSKNITMIKDVFPKVSTLYVQSFTEEGVTFPYSSLEKFPKLVKLNVEHCSFEEIFPSQDQIIIFTGKISPFKYLWRLSVSGCHQLIHFVTTTSAKSLVCLRWLEINDCKKMEEIVMNDTNEDVQGRITFNRLWKIKLIDMPSLQMFSSQSHTFRFPQLENIEISGCPKMKMFCRGVLETPKLSKVKIGEHDMEWKDEGGLNKTIKMLSHAKDSVNI